MSSHQHHSCGFPVLTSKLLFIVCRFEVKVSGNPKPTVKWHKQGVEIIPNKDFQVENYEDGTSVLTITEVFPDDVGEISCVVQNELGVDQTVTELEVHGKLFKSIKLTI